MNIAPAILAVAVDAAAGRFATLDITDADGTVLVTAPLAFRDAANGTAGHEVIRTRAVATGTASDFRILADGAPVVTGAASELSIDRPRLVAGDIVTITDLRVTIS